MAQAGFDAELVFDGHGRTRAIGRTRVTHSGRETADAVIERLAYSHHADREVTVVSSDAVLRHVAQRGGVHAMSAREFSDRLAAAPRERFQPPPCSAAGGCSATRSTRPCGRRSSACAAANSAAAEPDLTRAELGLEFAPSLKLKLRGQPEADRDFGFPVSPGGRRCPGRVLRCSFNGESGVSRPSSPSSRPPATATSARWTTSSAATRGSSASRPARTSWPAATRTT